MEETTIDLSVLDECRCAKIHTLCDETVQVLIVWSLDTQIAAADVVDCFVVDHERAVAVLESGVSGQDRVVRLDNGCGILWSWVDAELQLALLAVVDGQTFHEQSSEARASSTTKAVENQETLQTGAEISNASNLVQDLIDELLANSVVSTSIVVGCILLASNHLLRVEEGAVRTSADLIDDVWLQIAVDGTWYVFAIAYGHVSSYAHALSYNNAPVSEKKVEKP